MVDPDVARLGLVEIGIAQIIKVNAVHLPARRRVAIGSLPMRVDHKACHGTVIVPVRLLQTAYPRPRGAGRRRCAVDARIVPIRIGRTDGERYIGAGVCSLPIAQDLWSQPYIGCAGTGQEAYKPGPGFRPVIVSVRADRAKGHRVHYLAGGVQ